jgi:subtilase family serine protease
MATHQQVREVNTVTKPWQASVRVVLALLLGSVLTLLFAAAPLYAQPADRVTLPVDRTKTRALSNHVPAWANETNVISPLPANLMLDQMTLILSRSPEQEQELGQLLSSQQDPTSSNYHHWLTPTEMGERFGLSQQDIETVTGWLQSQGLHVNWVSTSRTSIGFNGLATDVGKSFQTQVNYYRVNGVQRFSISSPPMIPEALVPVVKAVRGLYTIEERPLHTGAPGISASPRLSAGSSHFLAPGDFATIYDLPSSLTGAGVSIGIVGEARTDFADFTNFRTFTASKFPNPTEIVPTAYGGVDPGPALTAPPAAGVSTAAQSEATLDVLRAGSVAPGAALLLVVATSASGGIGADAEYLVDTEPVPVQVMSISFGGCESAAGPAVVAAWDGLFQQAAAEGISVFVSSGDSGASGCDNDFTTPPALPSPNSPNFICSSSYSTCVGGTEFNDVSNPSQYWSSTNGSNFASALSYIPEGAWNEPLNSSSGLQVAASGGGVSTVIPTPGWQAGAGVPTARAGRYTPDVAFSGSGHDGYFACFAAAGGTCVVNSAGSLPFEIFYGTSAAAPGMAGVAALLDQDQGQAQGNLNPRLYQMAANAPAVFHDVTVSTSGVTSCSLNTPSMCNNSVAGPLSLTSGQAGFAVNTGYDEVTGLGSLDVASFVRSYVASAPAALQFVPVTPCRVVDTRSGSGPFAGPELAAGASREFDIPQSGCSIPSSAVAYSLNVTVIPNAGLGFLTLWASGQTQPLVSTLNSDGRVKANAAITPAGANGGVSVYVSDATQMILDIDGYFVPKGTASALAFYPVTPCRLVDTRNGTGPLGGPFLAGGSSRAFPLKSGNCGLPASAQAYSLNVTAVPKSTLNYLTLWATGQPQPLASTLNATTGAVAANAAIVPAAANGDISVFVSDSSDVVLDVDGYFAAPGSGGLALYTVPACRVLDTRSSSGLFNGDLQVAAGPSACAPPSTAEAYVLNATVVPSGGLGYLTLWPAGQTQPTVSTLNAVDGAITSNMAIVPTYNGNIESFSSSSTQLILDISGYLAP